MSGILKCPWCDKRRATQLDYDTLQPGEGTDLCWASPECELDGDEEVVLALRLALETATRERDEARANISEVIEPEFFDKVMAAAVSEKELAALVADRDAYKLRLSEVARDMAKSIVFWQKRATENGKRDCQCGPTHEGDSCIDCRFRAVTNDLCSALDRAVEAERGCGELHAELTAMNQRALDAEVERDRWKASYQTTEEVLGWVRAERDDIAACAESWMKRVAAAERERDEARGELAEWTDARKRFAADRAALDALLARTALPALLAVCRAAVEWEKAEADNAAPHPDEVCNMGPGDCEPCMAVERRYQRVRAAHDALRAAVRGDAGGEKNG